MKTFKHIRRLGLIAILGLSIGWSGVGCDGGPEGKSEPVVTKKIASAPKTKTPPRPMGQPQNATAPDASGQPPKEGKPQRLPFDPTGKADPFEPLFKEEPKPKAEVAAKPKQPERPRTPLERLDLGQLRLTAVVMAGNRPRAMVEEANGKGYVIELGTPIGLERGKVTVINRDRIVIEYSRDDDFGNSKSRQRVLKLQKPPGD